MTFYPLPLLISEDGTSTILDRVMLSGGPGAYNEAWLQNLLFAHPEALPVAELAPHMGPLIPVCTELSTGAGYADLLYVTVTGQIVLVETKLWRNPEARRAVVAQILDYAKELAAWTFEDLSRESGRASRSGPEHLLSCVRRLHPDLDEARFVDGINRTLHRGEFLLIIAGDGIRTGAESLVGFLEQYGHLRFQFGLVEIASYRVPGGAVLLQPRVLAKTEQLLRHVVLGMAAGEVATTGEQPQEPGQAARAQEEAEWCARFWGDYVKALRLDDLKQPPPKVARTTNVTLYMPPGGESAWVSAFIARASHRAGVFFTFGRRFDHAAAWYQALLEQREQIDAELPGLSWRREGDGKVWIETPEVHFSSLDDPIDRKRVIEHLVTYTNQMVNVFRHRLESLQRQGMAFN